jgi:MFS family permease
MGQAGSVGHVLAVRVVDRTGKGLRTSPRDALIAASVPAAERGAAFGFHRAVDHAGATIGPLIAAIFLALRPGDLRTLFLWTALPGALAFLVVLFFVRERDADGPVVPGPEERAPTAAPRGSLRRFLVPLALFTLGNASDAFLMLKASEVGVPLAGLPLLWVALNAVKSVTSLPGGRLADRFGERRTIFAGWLTYAAVYAGFAFAESPAAVWALFVVYGVHHGLTEGPEKALVARLAPAHARGTAFGWYHFTLGILTLTASILFGSIWELAGSRAAFLTSAALALGAVLALVALRPAPAPSGPAS